jgi:septation ring formation regulator EzrA
MQTYQSKFTGKQIDDAIDKISQMQTSIQNNANQITMLKTADTSIKNSVTAVGNRVTNLEEKTDTYEFNETYFQSLISNVGMVIAIAPSDIEKYKYFIVNQKEANTQNSVKFKLPFSYSTTIDGLTTYYYMIGDAYLILTLQYNSSTTMIAKLMGSGI